MEKKEFYHVISAIIIFSAVLAFSKFIRGDFEYFGFALFMSAIIILVSIFSKKIMAYYLDSGVDHELWQFQRTGLKPNQKLKFKLPAGIIFPLVFSVISLGIVKISTILTYEARPLKYRASKRFGVYSYTEMTDMHTAIIGGAGILGLIILAILTYFFPLYNLEQLSKFSIYYAFWNLLPLGKLDGAQIFFGSRTIWTTLAAITTLLTAAAILIP